MKKSIKYIILFLISYCLLLQWVNANCNNKSCKISDLPAQVLLDYLDDTRKVVKNITNGINKEKKDSKLEKDKNRLQKDIIQWYNQIINWDSYFSTFDYYITLPITSEIPYEVKRDHNLITREEEYLNKYLQKIISRWYSEAKIEKACSWVKNKNNCNLDNKEAKQILIELIKNTKKIWNLYRLSVSDKKDEFKDKDSLIIVDKKLFVTKITNYYNNNTLSDCSKCDEGFMYRVNEAIEKISFNFSDWDKWIKLRQDTWKLAKWIDTDEEKEIERKVLINELSRQWISWDNASTLLWNLYRYNKESAKSWDAIAYSTYNNFLTNTFSSFKRSISNQINEFDEAVIQTVNKSNKNKIWLKKLAKTQESISKIGELKTRIKELYQKELPYTQIQDNSTEALQTRIILMHYQLIQATNTLEKTIPISQDICANKQAQWEGNCWI